MRSQLCCPHARAGQWLSEDSLPLQPTSSSQMGPGAGAVVGFAHSRPDSHAAQLPAGHHAVPQVPAVITDRPPASSVPCIQPWHTGWARPPDEPGAGLLVGSQDQEGSEGVWRGQPSAFLFLCSPAAPVGRADPWMTLENLGLGAQQMAPLWPQGSLIGGPGWPASPRS